MSFKLKTWGKLSQADKDMFFAGYRCNYDAFLESCTDEEPDPWDEMDKVLSPVADPAAILEAWEKLKRYEGR
jgi:hypothetical protein